MWDIHTCLCMFVCTYVRTYVCMHACLQLGVWVVSPVQDHVSHWPVGQPPEQPWSDSPTSSCSSPGWVKSPADPLACPACQSNWRTSSNWDAFEQWRAGEFCFSLQTYGNHTWCYSPLSRGRNRRAVWHCEDCRLWLLSEDGWDFSSSFLGKIGVLH